MLDLKFVRENPDIVKQNIKNKFQDRKLPLVDGAINLKEKLAALPVSDKERRRTAENLERGRRQTIGMGTTGSYWR